MKRLITFVILAVLLSTAGFAARQKDLSGPIAIKGELQEQYEDFPAGTPVVIRNRNQRYTIRNTFFCSENH